MKKRIVTGAIIVLFLLCVATLILLFVFKPVPDDKVYATAIRKTVEIKCFDNENKIGYATGAVVAADGKILTNKHVVMNGEHVFQNIWVRFFDQTDFIPANVITVADTSDLALLTINKAELSFFRLAGAVKGGEKIFTVGNPSGFGLSFTAGYVSSPKRLVTYNESEIVSIQTDLVINEGNSGGPLFNASGDLLGIMSFRLRNDAAEIIHGVSFALHLETVAAFLTACL